MSSAASKEAFENPLIWNFESVNDLLSSLSPEIPPPSSATPSTLVWAPMHTHVCTHTFVKCLNFRDPETQKLSGTHNSACSGEVASSPLQSLALLAE